MPRCPLAVALVVTGGLSGCGLAVPDIKEPWDHPDGNAQVEYEVKKNIYCELRDAVKAVDTQITGYYLQDRKTGKKTPAHFLPDDWGVQVNISLQVDENSALNPGVALTTPFENAMTKFASGAVTTPQSFNLGLGATLSSTATRIDKFDPYYTIARLRLKETDQSPCKDANDPFIKFGEASLDDPPTRSSPLTSDLGLAKWLVGAMITDRFLQSQKADVVGTEIKFIIVTSGSVTPSWKLVRITATNGMAPLFAAGRTRTHDLIITIGPKGSQTASNSNLASQIRQGGAP